MKYSKALAIGHRRAEEAADALRRWTGVAACAVCGVKPAPGGRGWEPVGAGSRKEIVRDSGFRGEGKYHLLVVDESGTAKACTRDRFPLGEVLRLADQLPMTVAMPGQGKLSRALEEEDLRVNARNDALHMEA